MANRAPGRARRGDGVGCGLLAHVLMRFSVEGDGLCTHATSTSRQSTGQCGAQSRERKRGSASTNVLRIGLVVSGMTVGLTLCGVEPLTHGWQVRWCSERVANTAHHGTDPFLRFSPPSSPPCVCESWLMLIFNMKRTHGTLCLLRAVQWGASETS